MRLSDVGRTVLRVPGRLILWFFAGLGVLCTLLYLNSSFGPQVWNQVVIDTGDVSIKGGYISDCGQRYDIDVRVRQVKGAFPYACAGGADVLLYSQNAQYWCPGTYMIADPTVVNYRLKDGLCEIIDAPPRPGPRYQPPK